MIYDCFQFNDELAMLEIRLNHHAQFVDKFILTECPWTYSGKPKPLYYNRVKDAPPFKPFKDKIIHRVYDKPPGDDANWEYEHRQRNWLKGFNFKKDDLILYLDCDEIIRDQSVIDEAEYFDGIITLNMKLNWYYFNCMAKSDSKPQADYSLEECFKDGWRMGKILTGAHLYNFWNLYGIRQMFLRNKRGSHEVPNAGWHFSNFGEADAIYDKFQSFSHSDELNEKYLILPCLVQWRKEELRDPLGRAVDFERTELDVPKFITDNIEKYKDQILWPEESE